MENLNNLYRLVLENKANKEYFLKHAKIQHPNLVNAFTTFDQAVNNLKSKSLLSESIDYSELKQKNIFESFKEKMETLSENKVSKEVEDLKYKNRVFKDKDTMEILYSQQFLTGFYSEMQKDKNKTKTVDQLKQIVLKNLIKSPTYYTENDKYGIEGLKAIKGKEPEEVPAKTRHSGMIEYKKKEGN